MEAFARPAPLLTFAILGLAGCVTVLEILLLVFWLRAEANTRNTMDQSE